MSLKINVYATENIDKVVKLSGISSVKIYTADKKQEIEVKDKSFTVAPGEYCYEYSAGASDSLNGAGGHFIVTEDTTELKLESVYFRNVSPTAWLNEKHQWVYLPELGTLSLYDENIGMPQMMCMIMLFRIVAVTAIIILSLHLLMKIIFLSKGIFMFTEVQILVH